MLPPQRRGSFNKFMQQQDGGSAGALPPAARPDSPHSSLALPLRPNWRQTLASPHTCKWSPLHKYRLLKGAFASESPPLFFFFFLYYIPQPGRVKEKRKRRESEQVGKGGFGMCSLHPRPQSAGNPVLYPQTPGPCRAMAQSQQAGIPGKMSLSPSVSRTWSLSSPRPFPTSHASSPLAHGRFPNAATILFVKT